MGLVIYLLFLLFGLFLSKYFIAFQAGGDAAVIEMGTEYLFIVCVFSFGSIGFTIVERFLQATGKTSLSMISQISGALTNIILDYIFIFPCHLGIKGAAYATIIGQIISFLVAIVFQVTCNKEVPMKWRSLIPSWKYIKDIYFIGGSAMLMQALLSIMMLGMNLILGTSSYSPALLQGNFGIYYKVQQIPLFACFGLSNALITITSYNKELHKAERLKEIYKYGLIASLIVPMVFTVSFEILAEPIATLFGLASGEASEEIISTCTIAIRISALSYVFMGFTVGLQGILQGLRSSLKPLLLSCSRLVIFVFPIAFLFTLSENVASLVWFTFLIAEVTTSIIALFLSRPTLQKALVVAGETSPC